MGDMAKFEAVVGLVNMGKGDYPCILENNFVVVVSINLLLDRLQA